MALLPLREIVLTATPCWTLPTVGTRPGGRLPPYGSRRRRADVFVVARAQELVEDVGPPGVPLPPVE